MSEPHKFAAGHQVQIPFELVGLIPDGNAWVGLNGKLIEVGNKRGDKWFARPVGQDGPVIIVCTDDLPIVTEPHYSLGDALTYGCVDGKSTGQQD